MNSGDEFSDEALARFRALILHRMGALEEVAEMGRDAADVVTLDQSRVGRVSRMDAMQQQAMSQQASRRRILETQRLKSALLRLDSGDFGYCLRCDEQIAQARLEFDPSVTLCIRCAEDA